MKYFFLLPFIFVLKLATAQQTGTFRFLEIKTYPDEGSDTLIIDVAQTKGKFRISCEWGDGSMEYFILDSSTQKALELTELDEGKTAYFRPLDGKTSIIYAATTAGGLATMFEQFWIKYNLLEEYKTINELKCQKIAILDKGNVIGTGWVALGLHIGYANDCGFYYVKEGTLIEYSKQDENGWFKNSLQMVSSSNTVTNPQKLFSQTIPQGYKLGEYNWEEHYSSGESNPESE